jgi:CBS domain-containing protein
VETSAISYRVADFLKQHPPFNAIEEKDLVALADFGRVRFFAANEFIMWQGEPHKAHVYVIQQGTVSLWDERGSEAALRDVRGAGDLIGGEQFNGERACLYTAQATSDVVIYGFPAHDVEGLLERYPYAARFVAALGTVTSDFQRIDEQADPRRMFLHEAAGPLQTCGTHESARDAARRLVASGADAVAVVDGASRLMGLVTKDVLASWVASGEIASGLPLSEMGVITPTVLAPDASMVDGALAMARGGAGAVAMTADGTCTGRLLTVVTTSDLSRGFGDHPAAILPDIRRAADLPALRALNQRARACALKHLTSAASTDWIARFLEQTDQAILARVFALTGPHNAADHWGLCGTWGRAESLAAKMPLLVVVRAPRAVDSTIADPAIVDDYPRVLAALEECGYLPGHEAPFEPSFYVAELDEWQRRYDAWMRNPVLEGMQRSRALFDLRGIGANSAMGSLHKTVDAAVDRDILQILAHDCLADLPPLAFYEDAVVEHSGEMTSVFRLERNALQPLVDLGRVFGMAARDVMGTSTLDRFAAARRLLPAHEAIFREASEALRIVLWQQGRVGISQGTTGSELPPAVLSRHDRHLLKSAFPAIQRLLEFAADPSWLDASPYSRLDAL